MSNFAVVLLIKFPNLLLIISIHAFITDTVKTNTNLLSTQAQCLVGWSLRQQPDIFFDCFRSRGSAVKEPCSKLNFN